MSDTIFALSSGRLPAGVAVIRISGPKARFALETIFRAVPPSRALKYGAFRTANGAIIDRGMAVFFQGAASFTGEDCAEFYSHGGRAVVAALLAELATLPGMRPAEAGEFSRRAFLNGKFDLTEAEALADLISAETESQRRFALSNADGGQSELYASWRDRILHARAMIEAEIDFSDEGDIPGSVAARIWADMDKLQSEIGAHLLQYHRAEIILDGFKVVIAGAPNAGKSSLLNGLTKRNAAIVSDEPGTTRDVVDVVLDLGGDKVIFSDTAGMRDQPGKVEAMGIERTRSRLIEADLVLLLEDMANPIPIAVETSAPIWRIGAKADLVAGSRKEAKQLACRFVISSSTGLGLAELLDAIAREVAERVGDRGAVLPSRMRHIHLLQACRQGLASAETMIDAGLELRAEELRLASDALGRIAGAIDVEDMLGAIFAEFCVGK